MSKLAIFFLVGILIYKFLFRSLEMVPKIFLADFYIDQIVINNVGTLPLETKQSPAAMPKTWFDI